MLPTPARRLQHVNHSGPERYLATCRTFAGTPVFHDELAVAATFLHLRRTVDGLAFALLAYVFMPDHLHLILQRLHPAGDLRRCIREFQRASADQFSRWWGGRLWQDGHFDRALRHDERTAPLARYLFENPVRRRLARTPLEYPYLGSDVAPIAEFFRKPARPGRGSQVRSGG